MQDRDDYREHARSTGARRRTTRWSTWRVALVWIVVGAVLLVACRAVLHAPRDERPRFVPMPPATRAIDPPA